MTEYEKFIESKSQIGMNYGFEPLWIPSFVFDFQEAILHKAILKGRFAVFADCGLGKSPMELIWAENMKRKTNKPTLIICPLAVSIQMVQEAAKFDIEAKRSNVGVVHRNITITNYEQLHKFNPEDFGAVACDESSILKNFKGVHRNEITNFMRRIKYRSLWTATAAPNDFLELGTSSEALGWLGHIDMLGKFFKNDQNTSASGGRNRGRFDKGNKWRFKGHAEKPFWKWVCSWAMAIRRPSDLGFSDDKFILPPLIETQHMVKTETLADGYLFPLPSVGLKEQRDERRRSIKERCEKAVSLVDRNEQCLIWCHLNDEADLLEELIPHSRQISGQDTDEAKEEKFAMFINGSLRHLITKPKIGAWGLNLQNCCHTITFPSHSFEQYYQTVRRFYRFGQKRPVRVDIVASEGELNVLKNLQRKARQADRMFDSLCAEMNNAVGINPRHVFDKKEIIPDWLTK